MKEVEDIFVAWEGRGWYAPLPANAGTAVWVRVAGRGSSALTAHRRAEGCGALGAPRRLLRRSDAAALGRLVDPEEGRHDAPR